jgi:hypothetical protein
LLDPLPSSSSGPVSIHNPELWAFLTRLRTIKPQVAMLQGYTFWYLAINMDMLTTILPILSAKLGHHTLYVPILTLLLPFSPTEHRIQTCFQQDSCLAVMTIPILLNFIMIQKWLKTYFKNFIFDKILCRLSESFKLYLMKTNIHTFLIDFKIALSYKLLILF